MFWIDYMVNPEVTPPPLITTVKPLPINPKQLWEQSKSPDLERNLLEVETSAIEYLTAREEKQHEQQIDDGPIADSENESIFGEIVRKAAEHAAGKKKKKNSANRRPKSDIQFVMHAVANIKAATRFMLDVKIKSNVVSASSRKFHELSYEKVYVQKTVTAEDMRYLAERTTTESILNIIQAEIDKLPEFEWFQRCTLSEEQLHRMELQQVLLVEQATTIREACNKVLVRRKETTDRETISRITNEMQRKEEAKVIERQLKDDQKQAERERKQAEREKKQEEKEASKNARHAEKKKRSRGISTTVNKRVEDNNSDDNAHRQQSESIEADERGSSSSSSDVKGITKQDECLESFFNNNCSQIIEGIY